MRLKKIISQETQPELLTIGGFNVVRLNNSASINQLKNTDFHAIIIEDTKLSENIYSNDRLYLKPLFLSNPSTAQADGHFNESNPSTIVQKIEFITKNTLPFANLEVPQNAEDKFITKLLRYAISRNVSIEPQNSRKNIIGYNIPLASMFSYKKESLLLMKTLDKYEKEGLFRKKIKDKINVCIDCQSSYLNFSETCSNCHSLDLKTESLIHHFRCAYIGPESDFTKDNKLICPKCDKQLKHIGIDYDKPSEINICNDCNHKSQDSKMKAKCVDCQKDNDLDQLQTITISSYIPTETGKSFALKNHKNTKVEVAETQHSFLTHISAFNIIKSHEEKRNNGRNFELNISIEEHLLSNLSANHRASFTSEIAQIVHSYLSENDLICIDQKTIKVLMLSYDKNEIHEFIDVIDFNLKKLISHNCETVQNPVTITLNVLQS